MADHIQATHDQRSDCAVDTLRAIACLALVSFHVVGNSPASGMELAHDHWLSVMNATFTDMRMPLFSFLSGVVFVALGRTPRALITAKARRLLVPMLSVGALFWLVRDAVGQGQQPLVTIAFMPFAHFWFLQATFVIMATFVALSALSGGRSTVVAAAMMCLGAGSWVLGAVPNYNVFSVIQALYLMPFFMCGYLCNRIGLAKMDGVLAALILGGLGLIGYLLAVGSVSVDPTLRRAIAVLCGLVFCMTLLSVRPQNRFLARLGAMSYAIYLFHVFFTAGMREVLMHMWPQTPLALIWLICLVAGVTGPIVLYHIVTRNSLISLTVLGIMPRRKAGRTLWRSAPAMGLGKA